MATIINQKNGKTILRDTATNSSITLANLSVDATENVQSFSINQVFFASNGSWTVARGSNTVMVLPGTGHFNFAGHGISLNDFSNATISYTLSASAVGTIVLDLSKQSVANT